MYSCAGEKHVVLVLCDVHCFRAIDLYYYYLVFRSVYVHFNGIILNWDQVYSIGGATHIHNLNYCPRVNAVRCKDGMNYSVLPRLLLQGVAPCPLFVTPCPFEKAEMTPCPFD